MFCEMEIFLFQEAGSGPSGDNRRAQGCWPWLCLQLRIQRKVDNCFPLRSGWYSKVRIGFLLLSQLVYTYIRDSEVTALPSAFKTCTVVLFAWITAYSSKVRFICRYRGFSQVWVHWITQLANVARLKSPLCLAQIFSYRVTGSPSTYFLLITSAAVVMNI